MPLHAKRKATRKKKAPTPEPVDQASFQVEQEKVRAHAMEPLEEQPSRFEGVDGFAILPRQTVQRYHRDGTAVSGPNAQVVVIAGPFATAKYPGGIFQYREPGSYRTGWWRVSQAKGLKGTRIENEAELARDEERTKQKAKARKPKLIVKRKK